MFKKLIIGSLFLSILLTACTNGKEFSMLPEDIVAHALEANESIESYYIGYLMTFEESMVDLLASTFKEQTKNTLEELKKTHNIEIIGQDDVNGVKAYHLKGTPKKEDSINGEQEIWIDQESWLVLKTIAYGFGEKVETEVLNYDTSPEIHDSLFTQELPENAEIVNTDEYLMEEEILTMDELVEEMDESLLYLPESFGYELRQVKLIRLDFENMKDEAIQEYFKDDRHKFNFYNIKEKLDPSEKELWLGEKEIEIRGSKGYVLDDFMRTVSFEEDGIQYTVDIKDEEMEIEEVIEIIENMKLYK